MSLIQNKIVVLNLADMVGLFTDNGGLGKIMLPAPAAGKVNNILSISHWLKTAAGFTSFDNATFLWYYLKFVEGGNNASFTDNQVFLQNTGGGQDVEKSIARNGSFISTTNDLYLVSDALIDNNGSNNILQVNICFEVRDSVS